MLENQSNNEELLKAVDFFCGAGGVTCGFRQAGISVLAGVDIDSTCKKTYEENNPGSQFLCADVSNLPLEYLKDKLNITINDDNLIFVGCSPCQYYSNINTDKTKSKTTRLLLEDFQLFVDYYKPGYIMIENVPGLETKQGSPLSNFKAFLNDNDYAIQDKVVNAKYFGVPQNRRRYVMIASRVNKKICFPEEYKVIDKTVKDAIGDYTVFNEITAGHKDTTEFIHTSARLTEVNLKRIKSTSKNGGSRKDWSEELHLSCHKNHQGHTDVYGRMCWNGVAPTITTRFNSLSNGRYGHPEQDRAISLREGATLQSFPITYNFHASSQVNIARMIGNAVPPSLSKKIAEVFMEFRKKSND